MNAAFPSYSIAKQSKACTSPPRHAKITIITPAQNRRSACDISSALLYATCLAMTVWVLTASTPNYGCTPQQYHYTATKPLRFTSTARGVPAPGAGGGGGGGARPAGAGAGGRRNRGE